MRPWTPACAGVTIYQQCECRFDIRQLHLFAANYRIQQKVVELLYSQVENSLEVIVAPVDPESLKSSTTCTAV